MPNMAAAAAAVVVAVVVVAVAVVVGCAGGVLDIRLMPIGLS